MPLPAPEPGLVISYAYLWHHEHRAGREEGVKDRLCVVILRTERSGDGRTIVTLVPVTHTPPADPSLAIELPPRVKQALGLDDQRSWIVLTEGNRFVWPGFDVRPRPGSHDAFAYGFLPPKLFERVVAGVKAVWLAGRVSITSRD